MLEEDDELAVIDTDDDNINEEHQQVIETALKTAKADEISSKFSCFLAFPRKTWHSSKEDNASQYIDDELSKLTEKPVDKFNASEQEARDAVFKAIDTLRQPQHHDKPTIAAIYNILKEDLEDTERRNPIPVEQRIRSLITGYTELTRDFSAHAHKSAVDQKYGNVLAWLDAINRNNSDIRSLIDQYIPDGEKQCIIEEGEEDQGNV